ncbi:hypothetical protein [uncultured Ruminococcus sp.]|uniref:hypothetical protein n=1 Tax=uncultured Ruminococcus sp. TaxID=165186 RepID=UPI00292E4435|nr:hypothetical protein [uncultured Ruminococcus sp.]
MKEFFKTKITVISKNGSVIGAFDNLISIFKSWLEQKYGVAVTQRIIPDWSDFINGGSFNGGEKGKLTLKTICYKEKTSGTISAWACRIDSRSSRNTNFIPRIWKTDIGFIALSKNRAEISYYVSFEDLTYYAGHLQFEPKTNIPRIVQLILSNSNWKCIVNDKLESIDIKNYSPYMGDMFGFEDCRLLFDGKSTLSDFVSIYNEVEFKMENQWVSLCRVNRPDSKNNIWMRRLADYVGGTLIVPAFKDTEDSVQGNRKLIFCDSGPQHTDNIGFWKWTDYQNENGRWVTSATYISDLQPTEIIILDQIKNVGEIIEALKTGLRIPTYVQGKILFALRKDAVIKGVLCDLSKLSAKYDFSALNDDSIIVSIKKSVQALPYYEVVENDVFSWKSRKIQIDDELYSWEYRSVLKKDSINSIRQIPVYSLDNVIKQLFTERLTWPVFKAEGITKSDWRKVIELLKSIPKDTMVEQLSATYDLSVEEAQERIDSFLHTVEQHITVEDVDSGLIVKMLESHSGLKESCDKIAYQKWLEEHQADIAAAQEKVNEIRKKGDEEQKAAEQRLSAVKESIVEAVKERLMITSRIEEAEGRLGELQAEINKYEKLGNDTVEAVRKKIADSQQDIAGFIADLSMFLPQTGNRVSSVDIAGWRYIRSEREEFADDVEITENWKDEINLLSQNLSFSLGVNTELCEMLSAVIYSAYINHLPLLVIGPGSNEVSDCFSFSAFGIDSGKLIIGEGIDYGISEIINKYDEQVVSICNMFGKGWNDELPQILGRSDKQIIWTHPYVEDMLLEPKGLYNYMLPLLSETFVDVITSVDYLSGKRADGFEAYSSKRKTPIIIGAIKQLGISKYLLNRVESVLSDAKAIMDNTNRDKDLEIMFGLLPLAVLAEKTDVLKDTIHNESGISGFVKVIASRYCDEG